MSKAASIIAPFALVACMAGEANPYLDHGTDDTEYLNPYGREVEVDLEGRLEGVRTDVADAPAALAQFALTVLRRDETMYLESLAEAATSADRVEWKVNDEWYTAETLPARAKRNHFRIRGIDAVLLGDQSTEVEVGQQLVAVTPLTPYGLADKAGKTCADEDDSLGMSNDIYWYRWLPTNPKCRIETQEISVTVTKVFSRTTPRSKVYPEYDQLMADNKLTVVLMYGQVGHGPLVESDFGFNNVRRAGAFLQDAGFREKNATVGQRWEKRIDGKLLQVDVYGPREYAGLDDAANFANFQKAIAEHEVVSWTGHSMLGASDVWSQPTYPDFYQIFLYGGCLGYEYYVKPILAAKGGSWDRLDIVSSVVEVAALASPEHAALGRLIYGIEHDYRTTWRSILLKVRQEVGDSSFGVSGARDNKFKP